MPVKEIRLKCILSVAQANKMQRLINVDKSNVISDEWLPNEAEITILSARDTTRTWVPGRGIMGRNVGYIRTSIERGCHLGYRTNRVLFVSFLYRGGSRQAFPNIQIIHSLHRFAAK